MLMLPSGESHSLSEAASRLTGYLYASDPVQRVLICSDDALTLSKVLGFLRCLWERRWQLLRGTWPLLLPVVLFAAFVLRTGSIVLGA